MVIPHIGDVPDDCFGLDMPRWGHGAGRVQPQPLGPDHNRAAVAAGAPLAVGQIEAELVALKPAIRRRTSPEDVGLAEEFGDEEGGGAFVEVFRAADLFDPSLVEDRDSIGEGQCLLLVVGDEDEGHAQLAVHAGDLLLQAVAQLFVQSAERLVEQQGTGLVDDGAGQGDPLLLASGELPGQPIGPLGEAHQVQRFVHPRGDLRLGELALLEGVADVLPDGHVGEQRVLLEDDAEVPLVWLEPVREVKPAIIDSVVVFPEPLGPRKVTNSPAAMSRRRCGKTASWI